MSSPQIGSIEGSLHRLEALYLDRMREEDEKWKKQEEQRFKALEAYRKKAQKTIDLMNRSGQVRSSSSLGIKTIVHSFAPEDRVSFLNETVEERRARKLGETLPHGRGLSIQETSRHAGCKLSAKDIDDAYECTFDVGARNPSTEYAMKAAYDKAHRVGSGTGRISEKLYGAPKNVKDYLGYNGNRARDYDTAADLMKKYKVFSSSFGNVLNQQQNSKMNSTDSNTQFKKRTPESLKIALNYSSMPYIGTCNRLTSKDANTCDDDLDEIDEFTVEKGQKVNTRYFKLPDHIIVSGTVDGAALSSRKPELYRNPLDQMLKTKTNSNNAPIETECLSYFATGRANVYSEEIANGASNTTNLAETYNKFGAVGTIRAVHLANVAAERANDEPQSFSEDSDDEGASLALVAIANAANVIKSKKTNNNRMHKKTSLSGDSEDDRNSLVIDIDGGYSGKSVFGNIEGGANHDRDVGFKVIRRLKGKTLSLKDQVDRERDLQKELTSENLPKLKDILKTEYCTTGVILENSLVNSTLANSGKIISGETANIDKTALFLQTLTKVTSDSTSIDYTSTQKLNNSKGNCSEISDTLNGDVKARSSLFQGEITLPSETKKIWKTMKPYGTVEDYYPSSVTFGGKSSTQLPSINGKKKRKITFAADEQISIKDERINNEQPNQFAAAYLNVDPIAEFETLHAGEWN